MLTVYNGTACVTIVRKRPKETLTSAKTARVPFGDQPTKALEIPEVYDFYNHKIGAVNIADQLAATDYGCRRIKRGTWQALEHWLLSTVLVNMYLVSLYSNINREREVKFRNQRDFRI